MNQRLRIYMNGLSLRGAHGEEQFNMNFSGFCLCAQWNDFNLYTEPVEKVLRKSNENFAFPALSAVKVVAFDNLIVGWSC